jgi:cytochrome b561
MNITVNSSEPTKVKIVYWTPRLLCILAILFISLFSLDAFASGLTLWQQLGAFLMHMIPSFVLAALLAYAWRYEKTGGIIFLLFGLFFSPVLFNWNYRMNGSAWLSLGIIATITFPFVVVGILFLVHHSMKKRIAR